MSEKNSTWFTQHLVDSTAINVACTPVWGALEQLSGLSQEQSIHARSLGVVLTYAGLGLVMAQGRDSWHRYFSINDATEGAVQQGHDMAYAGVFNMLFSPVFYYAAGSRDALEIVAGTLVATGAGILFGGCIGYMIDLYRDLAGVKKSERVPVCIRERNSAIKKSLAVGLIVASLAATAGVYAFMPNRNTSSQEHSLEKTVLQRKQK